MQMASFYSSVVFKSNEYFLMLEKARQASVMRRLAVENREKEFNQEKGLLMAGINLKKPMQINFINKTACRLLQYTASEALSLSINAVMPINIAEIHYRFLEEFMITGKTRMLKSKRELFMKQKGGTVLTVNTYLFVNHLSRKHMILLFEQNNEYQVFEDPFQDAQYSYLLANKDFHTGELAHNFD